MGNVVFSGHLLAEASIKVGALEVRALHTSIRLAFSGSESGTNPSDLWISMDNGLILRQQETADLLQQAGPLGSVRYTEHMAITLESIVPVR
jgi:hypothetical protein